jgi:hypothetical protein
MVAVVILFFVLLSVTLILEIRYGILNPFPYKRIKYSAFNDSNFWKTFVISNKEEGFTVQSQPKTPLTDYVIVYSVYSKEHFSNVLKFLESGELWENWHCRVYIHDQCKEWIDLLKTKKNLQLYIVNDSVASSKNSAGDFWKLLPLCEPINAIILNDKQIKQIKKEDWDAFEHESTAVIKGTQCYPWPIHAHLSTLMIMKKSSLKLCFTTKDIQTYGHRSTKGSDEIFTTLEIGATPVKKLVKHDCLSLIFGKRLKGQGLLKN